MKVQIHVVNSVPSLQCFLSLTPSTVLLGGNILSAAESGQSWRTKQDFQDNW